MPLPVKSLPVVQNWDCHGCGDCCKTYHVRVSDAEKAKIEAQDWTADPELKGQPAVVWDKKDRAFRDRFRADPGGALAGLDLSAEERDAFARWDTRKLNELGGMLHLLISIPGLGGH